MFTPAKVRKCVRMLFETQKSLSLQKKLIDNMTKFMRTIGFMSFTAMMLVLSACKNKEPSVFKVFVRSSNNELVTNAKVVIIGDVNSDPATAAHADTLQTNSSGFVAFDLSEYYDELGKDQTTGYFDIIAKKDPNFQGTGYAQTRAHNTAVETVYLEP